MPLDYLGAQNSNGESAVELIKSPFGSAPTGYGQYDQLFAANPYRQQTYNRSFWQNVAGALGFRTGYDDWLDQTSTNIAEYDAGIYSMMQQNQYNSPAEQAARMRAAGQNPDLLGTGDVSDAASPVEDPNGMSPQNSQENATRVLSFVGSVGMSLVDLIPKTMSFMTSLTNLRGIRMDNDLKELTFNSNIEDYVKQFFATGITKNDYVDAFSQDNFENLLSASEKNSDDLASRLFSSKRGQKLFKMNYGRYARSLVAEMSKYKNYEEYEQARGALLKTRSSQFFSDDDDTQQTLIRSILGPFERYQKRVNEINERIANRRNPDLEQGLENSQMENQLAYENALDPTLQAQTENAGNEYQKQLYEIQKATDDMFSEIMKALDDADKWYSPIAKALLGIARAQLLSGFHGSFQRQSYRKFNGDTGVVTDEARTNAGINF